jgi:hypothetical protein
VTAYSIGCRFLYPLPETLSEVVTKDNIGALLAHLIFFVLCLKSKPEMRRFKFTFPTQKNIRVVNLALGSSRRIMANVIWMGVCAPCHPRPEVLKLWIASLGGGGGSFMKGIYFEIWAQDKIYILVDTLLG